MNNDFVYLATCMSDSVGDAVYVFTSSVHFKCLQRLRFPSVDITPIAVQSLIVMMSIFLIHL